MHTKCYLMLIFLFVLHAVTPLFSHQMDIISYSNVEIIKNKALFLNLPNSQTHLFYAGYPDIRQEIKDTIKVSNNGEMCPLTHFLTHQNDRLSTDPYFFIAQCEEPIEVLQIKDSFPLDNAPSLIYNITHQDTTLTFSGTSPLIFTVKTSPQGLEDMSSTQEDSSEYTSTASNTGWQLFFYYVWLGLTHILLGLDHIFFIVGFVLLSHSLRGLLKGITGFTLSHSITLALAAQSILSLPSTIVEPLIALSIAVVGILAIFRIASHVLSRFLIIFGFGLFHGLGFAGSIAEVGFPKEGFIASLLGFNIGIEAGQLLIVSILYPILVLIKRKNTSLYSATTLTIAYIITSGGLFWTFQRIFF